MLDKSSHKGFWSLICDCETVSPTCSTGINTMLEILSKLQEKLPELFPMPPKAMRHNELDNLLVFTSDDSVEGIKKSAEAIRSNVDFPFIMYYFLKKDPNSKDKRMQYRHTPDGELYKSSNKDNSAGSSWKLISKNTKLTAVSDELLPSQVTDRDHIHLPTNEEDFKKATNGKGGKWILHCSDWETLDNLWKNLIRLYDTGVLVGLKSCSAKFSVTEISPSYHTKAIMCYTADADCKLSVKRAAQSIFICTGYDFEMYYKSNEASLVGRYRHEGFASVSKYMFTSRGEMFERDYLRRWKKIIFNEGEHEEIKKEHTEELKPTVL
ncbi:hypothetical protein AVEN_183041-1 [Araneus ventricosus]|uniref:Uncharacterized protein n=1 Tax=Araneus ventricosus TaxID=182803 RepID=A0A4Y2EX34_ARAVE|nr:hypothetical protein AVEN_183041-1 [Araneus ventricosus]